MPQSIAAVFTADNIMPHFVRKVNKKIAKKMAGQAGISCKKFRRMGKKNVVKPAFFCYHKRKEGEGTAL